MLPTSEEKYVAFQEVKVKDVKDVAKRQPFRPFAVRLNNGARYLFERSDDLGAPKDFRIGHHHLHRGIPAFIVES